MFAAFHKDLVSTEMAVSFPWISMIYRITLRQEKHNRFAYVSPK